ncbi:MAG: prepilin-type N-terminal cleavage/methylation domain-containing protein [bacterium]|nr:prepilin-type N-terminal cleavage/methylation domain-containing protein [bacterium]
MKLSERGFTLVEIAIVLVVVGLLVGISAPMVKFMSQRAKRLETIQIMKASKAAISGYALTYNRLPAWGDDTIDGSVPPDEFCEIVSKRTDSLAQPFRYIYDNSLLANLCSSTSGRLSIVPIGSKNAGNIGFAIMSAGPDYQFNGTYGNSRGVNGATTLTQEGDDYFEYMSIFELQEMAGCSTKVCTAYEVWNDLGSTAEFLLNSSRCVTITANEIIASIGPGSSIQRFPTGMNCIGSNTGSLSYNNIIDLSIDTDFMCDVYFNRTDKN